MRTIPTLLTAAMQNRHLPPRQRLDAGLLLADLHILPADLDDFVPITAKAELGYDFRMGKYPVTNAQFRRFVDEDGYAEDRPWWTEEAVKDMEQWEWNKEWRNGPRLWGNPRFDRATQPVTGVTWYEAVAYCRWLTGKLRAEGKIEENEEVRLPTEDEWMRAARGPHPRPLSQKRRGERDGYPWGPDFDAALANTEESELGQTTPVHMYPGGKSSEGVWDLAGNVWEWLHEPIGDLKGGSWFGEAERAKASSRRRPPPRFRGLDFGIRVVVVLLR
jgi:formylglycine-generating enzyme required for sulfatase activity